MKKILLLIIFLSSCTIQDKNNLSSKNLDFSQNMEFENFKSQLEIYAKNSSYPKIDE